jgi:hypothetical protein
MKRGMSQMEWGNILRRIHTDWHQERWANVGTVASVLYKEVNTFGVNYEVGNNMTFLNHLEILMRLYGGG